MTKKRNHYRYILKKGRKKVYIGITKDPERREEEHKQEGKDFSHMEIIKPKVSKETVEQWEENSLKTYRKGHQGKNPKYNE
ncbi:hypothetical protein ES703_65606 [subsurface metagenome]